MPAGQRLQRDAPGVSATVPAAQALQVMLPVPSGYPLSAYVPTGQGVQEVQPARGWRLNSPFQCNTFAQPNRWLLAANAVRLHAVPQAGPTSGVAH